jgi:hypothetical protein
MSTGFQIFQHANELPEAWDALLRCVAKQDEAGGNPYLTRSFLAFLEAVNPCDQRYHLSLEDQALFVSYRLKLDLLNFSRFGKLKVPVRMVGVPMSVSSAGFASSDQLGRDAIDEWLRDNGRGLTVLLNVPSGANFELSKGSTLSSYKLSLGYDSFEAYLAHMRSPYRRQAHKALKAFEGVAVSELPSSLAFDEALYQLYLEVYERSEDKLERLGIQYFRAFPGRTFCFSYSDEPIAFVQTLDHSTAEGLVRYFVLGGFNGAYVERVDLYRNLLFFLVRSGIESGCGALELGQTAAESKAKTGAVEVPKHLYLLHSNRLVNWVLEYLVPHFSYKRYDIHHHVLK